MAKNSDLKNFMDRLVRLDEERSVISEDMWNVLREAKAVGYDPKIMRKILTEMKRDKEKRREERELIETYLQELGLW